MTEHDQLPPASYADRLNTRRTRALELHQAKWSKAAIARELGVSAMTIGRWLKQTNIADCASNHRRGPRLSDEQLRQLNDVLHRESSRAVELGQPWNKAQIVEVIQREFGVSYHPKYVGRVLDRIHDILIQESDTTPYFSSSNITLYLGDAIRVLDTLRAESVDCIVTSPPYYGQRDYGVSGQIGLEPHPQEYVDRLVAVFHAAKRVLKPTGSLWVNLGDTYWSGKGRPHGPDLKQRHRRFLRPQDKTGRRPLCVPKQLLLIPHRFAIAMQEDDWIVRNDNVWFKVNPTPDPAEDRCASAHEYMFHIVKRRKYYYDYESVAVPSQGERDTKAPPSVWQLQSAPTFKKHIAAFPETLVRIPILATLPANGVLLDPFCGSGTALSYAVAQGGGRVGIGIDISEAALEEAQALLAAGYQQRLGLP